MAHQILGDKLKFEMFGLTVHVPKPIRGIFAPLLSVTVSMSEPLSGPTPSEISLQAPSAPVWQREREVERRGEIRLHIAGGWGMSGVDVNDIGHGAMTPFWHSLWTLASHLQICMPKCVRMAVWLFFLTSNRLFSHDVTWLEMEGRKYWRSFEHCAEQSGRKMHSCLVNSCMLHEETVLSKLLNM